jgi:subtilase family serine protease
VETDNIRRFNVHSQSSDPEGAVKDENVDDNDVSMNLRILFPDLAVVRDVRHPSSISNGEIVTVSAEIKNAGDIEAREVLVTFYVDDKEVKTQTINILPKDSSRLIPFTWQAIGGKHELTIKVDPEDAIVEKYENNNEKSKDVNVQTGGIAELLTNRSVCSVIPIIIVVIILLLIIMIIKKRGSIFGWKPGSGGGEEEL